MCPCSNLYFFWRFLYALIFTMLSPVFFWILSLFILGSKYVKVYFRFLIFIFMVKIVFISMYFLILFFLILKFILVSKCSRNLTFSVFESILILGYSVGFLIFSFINSNCILSYFSILILTVLESILKYFFIIILFMFGSVFILNYFIICLYLNF